MMMTREQAEALYRQGLEPTVAMLLELSRRAEAAGPRPRALFKLGRSQEELGKKKDAKATFQRLVDEYIEAKRSLDDGIKELLKAPVIFEM